MAKSGLDYFPLACSFEDKVELIEAEFGLRGLAIIVKLYQRIYGEFGYYCEWNDEVALLFSRKACGLAEGDNVVSEVIKATIKRDIFDRDMFLKYGILTSVGIQKRYFEAAKRRNEIEVEKSYLLLSASQIPKNVHIIQKNVYRNEKNVCRNQQSKVKESKGNNNSSVATPAEPKPATVTFTEDSFEIKCVDRIINSCLKTFPNSKVPQTLTEKQKWAIEIDRMKRLDGRTELDIMQALNYAITDSFWQGNIRSAKKFREKFETLIVRSRTGKKSIGSSFNQFKQNDYDFDSLEKELLEN